MTLIKRIARFDVPVERVFELGCDFKRYPEWSVNYPVAPEILGPTPLGVGTKLHSTMQILGRRTEGTSEIVKFDPPRVIEFKGTSVEGGSLRVLYRLTPLGTSTDCEIEYEYEPTMGILGQIADRLFVERAVERDIDHSIENFKALVELKMPVLV
ncbi:MAG TPA: SRPBCC family protein [Candidatus Limnocylindrales bacterium]|nr:SRPBCC family protein [Candidatus Limnocylindrales bacterium]